ATAMGTRWKGMDLFVDAMAQLAAARGPSGRRMKVVTFGAEAFDAPALNGLVEVQHLGPVNDRRMMSLLYNAADVYVVHPRTENPYDTATLDAASGRPRPSAQGLNPWYEIRDPWRRQRHRRILSSCLPPARPRRGGDGRRPVRTFACAAARAVAGDDLPRAGP